MQLSASRLEMKGMQKLSHGQFREGIRAWIPKYAHLAVDSSHLNVSQVNMLLDELGKAKKGSIETLDLPLGKVGVSMGKLTASLKTISDRNPKSKIQLSFHGRKMTAADGEKFGDALVGNRVTLVGLDATHGGEGMAAILDKIPESNVETLDIAGRDVTVYEKEIMQAMPKLQTLALNGSTTATAEALQNHKAAMARMESAFKQADKTFVATDLVANLNITERYLTGTAATRASLAEFKSMVPTAFDVPAVTADLYYAAKDGEDRERQTALLNEMATNTKGHLQLVDFKAWDLPGLEDGLGKDITKALEGVSRNHPYVKIVANFNGTPFTLDDAKMLTEALPIAKTSILSLDNCSLDAAGTSAIAQALKHTPSMNVDMCNNTFDDEGVRLLADALPTLGKLTLSADNFSPAQKARLDTAADVWGKPIDWS